MKYLIYMLTTGEIDQVVDRPDFSSAPPYSEQYGCFGVDDDVDPDRYKINVNVDPVVLELLPAEPVLLATWHDIRAHRNMFEEEAIATPHGTIDADITSIQRLDFAVKQFTWLEPKVGGELGWKMADNTVEYFSFLELKGLYEEAEKAKSIRAAKLHAKAEVLRALTPAPTLSYISDLSNWMG